MHDEGFIGIILPESFLQMIVQYCKEKVTKWIWYYGAMDASRTDFENNCSLTIVLIAQKENTMWMFNKNKGIGKK